MTRWRVTVWLKNRPQIRAVKYKRAQSLRDASDWAVDQVARVLCAHKSEIENIGFTLEYLDGGLQGWHIRYSSESEHWQEAIRHAR